MKPSLNPAAEPLVLVISGPSGVGKDAILNRMKGLGEPLEYIVTVTTRPKRPQERDNKDYRFISDAKFKEMIAGGQFLEFANVYGNYYGVPSQPVKQALKKGSDVFIKVDVQGAATLKKVLPQAVFIFVLPPSMDELIWRLKQRLTESAEALERRLEAAAAEMKQLAMFDYAVINKQDEVDLAVKEIKAIITAEKRRVSPRKISL